jgi:hypothetical protein
MPTLIAAATVLGWLTTRLAQLIPPRRPERGRTQPLAMEVRLDAVAAVIGDGVSYRRAGWAVGISKTEVGDSMAAPRQRWALPARRHFVTTLDDLRELLAERPRSARRVDGLATRVQRPPRWANQKVR